MQDQSPKEIDIIYKHSIWTPQVRGTIKCSLFDFLQRVEIKRKFFQFGVS